RDPERVEEALAGEQADVVVEADPAPIDRVRPGQLEVGEAVGDSPGGEVDQYNDEQGRRQHGDQHRKTRRPQPGTRLGGYSWNPPTRKIRAGAAAKVEPCRRTVRVDA